MKYLPSRSYTVKRRRLALRARNTSVWLKPMRLPPLPVVALDPRYRNPPGSYRNPSPQDNTNSAPLGGGSGSGKAVSATVPPRSYRNLCIAGQAARAGQVSGRTGSRQIAADQGGVPGCGPDAATGRPCQARTRQQDSASQG